MAITVPRYTVDDLDAFPDDGNRYELLDGLLLVTPSPANGHQLVCTRMARLLGNAWEASASAHVAATGVVHIPPGLHLEPDILVYPSRFTPGNEWSDITEHWLAIEVLSPSSRMYDREFKRDAYLAVGVKEVWLVDIAARTVEVCRSGGSELVADVVRWCVPELDYVVAIDLSVVFDGVIPDAPWE